MAGNNEDYLNPYTKIWFQPGENGELVHTAANANGPSALMFAWMGPFIGALIRPVGGWIADKVGGAKVTQWVSVTMIASALGVAYYMNKAYTSATPEDFFVPFFLLFLVLFAATGVGNGSTFRTIAVVFDQAPGTGRKRSLAPSRSK